MVEPHCVELAYLELPLYLWNANPLDFAIYYLNNFHLLILNWIDSNSWLSQYLELILLPLTEMYSVISKFNDFHKLSSPFRDEFMRIFDFAVCKHTRKTDDDKECTL
jgi:hypothetical protein